MDEPLPEAAPETGAKDKPLSAAAVRALKEAEARRQAEAQRPPELGGPDGPEPTRYGDWERKGVAIDF
jgi:hypothetical protein